MSFDFPLEDCSEFGNFVITLIQQQTESSSYNGHMICMLAECNETKKNCLTKRKVINT